MCKERSTESQPGSQHSKQAPFAVVARLSPRCHAASSQKIILFVSRTLTPCGVRAWKKKPKTLAATTSAASSGEPACKPQARCTVMHSACGA